MKTITATKNGISINYEVRGKKSSFIRYDEANQQQQSTRSENFFEMNVIQRNMYRRLFYGMEAFSAEEVKTMSKIDISKVTRDHSKATKIVNQLKYQKYFGDYNKLLSVLFPHVKLDFYKDGQDVSLPSLKELKITTVDIIDKWVEEKLLPENFYNLNIANLAL
jgi:hypothetical protein